MKNTHYTLLLVLLINCVLIRNLYAQSDRFITIQQNLNELSKSVSGLNQKVDFSVSGVTIQEFLRGLGESNNLNINVDPQIDIKLVNNFKQESVINILIFLCKEYDLDIKFVGSIMSIHKYIQPIVIQNIVVKDIKVKYNSYTNLISLDLRNDTLSKVIKKITQLSKKNIIISPKTKDIGLNIYIEELPLESALEKLAFSNKLRLLKMPDQVYVFEPLNENDDPLLAIGTDYIKSNNKSYNATQRVRQSVSKINGLNFNIEEDSLHTKRISLDAIDVSTADIVKSVASALQLNYFLFTDLKGIINISVSNVEFETLLNYVFKNTDYTFKKENSVYLIGDRKMEGIRTNRILQLTNRSVDFILEIIPTELKKGVEIKEFKELNCLLLSGSFPQISEIESFVKQLDRVVPMVTIEIILMDIRKGKSVTTGIKMGVSDSVNTGGTLLSGLDFTMGSKSINDFLYRLGRNNIINLGKVSPSFYANISALEQNSNVEVRSMPKLTTLNGHDANLSIGSTRYYSITTQNVLGSLNPQTVITQQYNPIQANLNIQISPSISGDEQVTLKVDVAISDFIGDPPDNAPPPSSTSQFKSLIRVRNDEMIILGGIERTEKSDSGTGTPFLSRIPVLKWIFSSRTKSNNKVVSVVFIRPTINY